MACRFRAGDEEKEVTSGDAGMKAALLGGLRHRHGLMIAPDQAVWTSTELKAEASLMKERREAREERALQSPGGTSRCSSFSDIRLLGGLGNHQAFFAQVI